MNKPIYVPVDLENDYWMLALSRSGLIVLKGMTQGNILTMNLNRGQLPTTSLILTLILVVWDLTSYQLNLQEELPMSSRMINHTNLYLMYLSLMQ